MTKEDLLTIATLLSKYHDDLDARTMLARINQILQEKHNHVVFGAVPFAGAPPS